ncbi:MULTISPECIES: DUF6221 family protein [Streptomyces rochei group]|uniref:DUF6221 family protein n=1 Tax=Streptomyces rochei group TaxID=2867164 RepID=UPI001873A7B9|nr:DUF6221 family protein [Streptomyces vinaceusdrappus]GHC36908.1 hypothetical protein GCM10010308_64270 [Streptomyces vinaceusdrappus]
MDDLVQWLRAQLDEDERTARAADEGPWQGKHLGRHDQAAVDTGARGGLIQLDGPRAAANGTYIVVHDPSRVLREIDAKRRTLIRCEEAMLSANPMLVHFAKQTAWEMTLPYADRPGYRDEGRP